MTEQRPESLPDAVTADGAQNRGVSEARLRQLLTGDLPTITAEVPAGRDRRNAIRQSTLSRRIYGSILTAIR